MNCIFLLVFCLSISLLVNLIFRIKKRVDLYENNIYSILLIFNVICIILELICNICAIQGIDSISDTFVRLFLCGLLFYGCSLTIYTVIVENDKSKTQISRRTAGIMYLIALLACIPLFFLKLDLITVNGSNYADGDAVRYMVGFSSFFIAISVFFMIKKVKKIGRKAIPIISYIVLLCLAVVINKVDPSIPAINCIETFVILLMYFTIENPDVKMLQQVELEKDRADKANQAKSDFLSSMSHEIRTPLNAIVGFSECINQSETLEEAKENAKDIVGASETLLEIVNGILDISKIESGKIELIESDYSPYKMIDETVKLARGRLGDKALDFQVNIAQDIPKVLYGDKFNIKKIIINFLTNAIKYTDEGFVNFTVQCVKMNGYVRLIFSVSDSGRGIKKEDISKLFTKFQRLDEEKNQTIEGTGLGLAITKQLIDMMKGTVVVDSVYGEGSKFTFSVDQKISDAVLDDTTSHMDVVIDLTGKKILVVDDNKLNLKVADKLLKIYNPSITLCNSGADCIELINNNNKFDLILLDDMMPGKSGVETLTELRANPMFNIPTIALTANAINGMKEKYLDAGFDGYLAKPIDKSELNRTLVKFLNPVSSYDMDNEEEEEKQEVIPPKPMGGVPPIRPVVENVQPVEEKVVTPVQPTTPVVPSAPVTPTVPPITVPQFVPSDKEIVINPGTNSLNTSTVNNTSEQVNVTKESSDDGKILLIVDDNNINIKVESKLISSLGYKVESANSGVEAINMVKNGNYDLIFMDIMMPMMDGVQTLHELQKIEGFDIPVVALTADAVYGAKEKYLAEGFDLYVTKPANKDDFDKIIKKFVE